jgi:hypothetical protein
VSLRRTGIASSLGWASHITDRGHTGLRRLRHVRAAIRDHLTGGVDLAVMEGPAFSRALQRGHDELSALRWWVADAADHAGVPLAIAPSTSVKLFALGKGRLPGKGTTRRRAEKEAMIAAARALYPDAAVKKDDEADALMMARMGHAWLDTWCLSPTEQRGLAGVAWPEQEVTLL